MSIFIVDYGVGNIRSVQKAFERIGYNARLTSNRSDITSATKIILPGVGNFQKGLENLKSSGLLEPLNDVVLDRNIPILGICLGMQLMTSFSEEGNCEGLNWISAKTKKFSFFSQQGLKIPHMGWNEIHCENERVDFAEYNNTLFYFVHSYYVLCESAEDVLFKSKYGVEFVSGFKKRNIWGVQFHPEKSHKAGLTFLKKFISQN